jgi:mannose-6-phosphate isomerase-like protein (cupin superfamily)
MVAMLDGGCVVTGLHEGEPLRDGALTIWNHFRGDAVSLRVMKLDGVATLRNETCEEVLYVLEGSGSIAAHTGIYLPPGSSLELQGTMTLVSAQCDGSGAQTGKLQIVSLEDKPLQRTGDRSYSELISQQVTQFVGVIPPGRAPDHYHLYEEVICILEGEGAMWAGASQTPIAAGSCIFLPRRQVHCVENKGTGAMRLLGVFYPAGSPAVRYSD